MVYESDFYTTRRPYSRPTVTSYSVTRREVPWHLVPTVPRPSQVPPCYTAYGSRGFATTTPYHKNIPYIGHKRLVIVQPSAHGWRVKQSVLLGEIDRIYHKVRPSLAYQPKEDYLNSRSIMSFDDETRSIRAKTAELLKKIHTPVPRAQRPLPLPGEAIDEFLRLRHELSNVAMKLIFYPTSLDYDRLYYSHTELPITERIMSNNYIDRLLSSSKGYHPVTVTYTQYEDPRTYSRMGKGHLACLTYAGGRPISRRKNLASVEDYIRDDINVLSHYNRFRQAAEKAPHMPDTEYGSIPHRPPTKSPITGSWKSNAPRRTQSDKDTARINDISTGDDAESQERKKKRREAVEEAALKEAEDEKRRNQELKRQEELAEQAAAERQAELERKAREEEERLEALRQAQEEEERKAKEEEEARIAREEEERKAMEAEKKAEAKRKAKEEAARRAEEERKAREEEEMRLKEEEERKAREEEERKAKEEEERKAREEEERRLKEEEERLAREEEERRLKEEEERKAEEERLAKEEEERKALEEQQAQEPEPAEEEVQQEEKPEEPEEVHDDPQPEEVKEQEAEETGNEPLVEEPQSPDVTVVKQPGEDEEEEEEEED